MQIVIEPPKIELGKSGQAVLRAYLSLLLIGGNVGLPLVLGTLVVSHTASRRYPTLINMLISWITYATAALLLCVLQIICPCTADNLGLILDFIRANIKVGNQTSGYV